jgi:hypothetical protein
MIFPIHEISMIKFKMSRSYTISTQHDTLQIHKASVKKLWDLSILRISLHKLLYLCAYIRDHLKSLLPCVFYLLSYGLTFPSTYKHLFYREAITKVWARGPKGGKCGHLS